MYIDKFRNEKEHAWIDENEVYHGTLDEMDEASVIISYYFRGDSGGEDDKFLKCVLFYLKMIDEKTFPKDYDGLFYVIIDYFDKCELIESGVSVRFAWLTEKGKNCLADIKEFIESSTC
jgi:hypothetical protein